MKKIILSFAILLALFASAFASNPGTVNERVVASFHKDFRQATEVNWAETNNYVLATFHMDNKVLYAYYDYQGKLAGLVHHILTSSLPANLQKDLKKYYAEYWVSDLFQVTNDEVSYYFIELKNADETIVLSTEGTNGWHNYTVAKK